MSTIDPIVSAIALIALARTQNVQIALIAALFALPILVLFAPSPFELALTILIEGSIVFVLSEMLRINGTRAVLACCFVGTVRATFAGRSSAGHGATLRRHESPSATF